MIRLNFMRKLCIIEFKRCLSTCTYKLMQGRCFICSNLKLESQPLIYEYKININNMCISRNNQHSKYKLELINNVNSFKPLLGFYKEK